MQITKNKQHMKMRIKESQLREMIRKSLNEYVNKTDRTTINKTKNAGDFQQPYQGDAVTYKYNLPGYAVVVRNVKDDGAFALLQRMSVLTPIGEYFVETILNDPELNKLFRIEARKNGEIRQFFMRGDRYDMGYKLFAKALGGELNQLYGSSKYADEATGTVRISMEDDPIKFTYGPNGKNCPFELINGIVTPKEDSEIDQYFESYSQNDAVQWDLATCHSDGSFIFFFHSFEDRNNFVRQLKNMFMIASHLFDKARNGFYYTFIQAGNAIEIVELGGINKQGLPKPVNPLTLLNEEDDDLLAVIQFLTNRQESDEAQRQLETDPEYIAKKEEEEQRKREREADAVINAYGPSYLSPAPSLARNNATVDESTLVKMIKESIKKVIKEK